jgi:hypothetical protein
MATKAPSPIFALHYHLSANIRRAILISLVIIALSSIPAYAFHTGLAGGAKYCWDKQNMCLSYDSSIFTKGWNSKVDDARWVWNDVGARFALRFWTSPDDGVVPTGTLLLKRWL